MCLFQRTEFLESDTVASKQSESNFTLALNNEAQSPSVDAGLIGDQSTNAAPSVSSTLSVSSTPAQSSKEVPTGIPTKRKFRAREREDISTVLDLQLINHLKKKDQNESTGKSENELFCKILIPMYT